jgi:hypothetical protein
MISQTKAMLDQAGARIRALEAENTILKTEISKAGIKIPLTEFSGAIVGNKTEPVKLAPTSPLTTATGSASGSSKGVYPTTPLPTPVVRSQTRYE